MCFSMWHHLWPWICSLMRDCILLYSSPLSLCSPFKNKNTLHTFILTLCDLRHKRYWILQLMLCPVRNVKKKGFRKSTWRTLSLRESSQTWQSEIFLCVVAQLRILKSFLKNLFSPIKIEFKWVGKHVLCARPILSTLHVSPQSALTCPEQWGSLSLLGITRLKKALQVNWPITCPPQSKPYLHSVLFTSDLTDLFPFS